MESYYRELGLEPGASFEEIKKAWRSLMAKYHPDRHPGPASEEMSKRVNDAYQKLKKYFESGSSYKQEAPKQEAPKPEAPKPEKTWWQIFFMIDQLPVIPPEIIRFAKLSIFTIIAGGIINAGTAIYRGVQVEKQQQLEAKLLSDKMIEEARIREEQAAKEEARLKKEQAEEEIRLKKEQAIIKSRTINYPNGTKYIGDIVNGNAQGEGIVYFKDGSRYVGQMYGGYQQGNGTTYFANGDKTESRYFNGNPVGKATYYWANGAKEEGVWSSGRFTPN